MTTTTAGDYRGCEAMIHGMAHRYGVRFGLDRDDALGEAMLGYAKALATYDPVRSNKFSTWAYWQIRGAVQEAARKELKHRHRVDETPLEEIEGRGRSVLAELLSQLGEDAKAVVKLVLKQPRQNGRPVSPDTIRCQLAEALLDMGWAAGQVAEAFEEIREALR